MADTKLKQLRALVDRGDTRGALRLANSFQQLGAHSAPIRRGWQAIQSRQFYIDIGQDPDALVVAGLAAIKARYDWD